MGGDCFFFYRGSNYDLLRSFYLPFMVEVSSRCKIFSSSSSKISEVSLFVSHCMVSSPGPEELSVRSSSLLSPPCCQKLPFNIG